MADQAHTARVSRPPTPADFAALLALTRALSALTNLEAFQDALGGPLLAWLPSRDVSVVRAVNGGWEALVGPDDAGQRIHEYAWTPLLAGGKTIGMLGFGASSPDGPAGHLAEGTIALLAMCAQGIVAFENLRLDSIRDGLTGCVTRAHAMELLEVNLRRSNRTGLPVSVIVIDIDDFKRINDRFGHVPGDAVLAAVGGQLHGMLRQSDIRCRLGGDEFLVILPDTPLTDAMHLAESLRHAIEELAVPSVRGTLRFTASMGVAAAACGGVVDVGGFIDRADVALYRAKQAGRNGVQACASSAERLRQATRNRHQPEPHPSAPRKPALRLATSRSA